MPTFSSTLEQAIHAALSLANQHRHELATLEHLLLALTEEPDAVTVMKACNVDLDELRRMLTDYIDDDLSTLVTDVDLVLRALPAPDTALGGRALTEALRAYYATFRPTPPPPRADRSDSR